MRRSIVFLSVLLFIGSAFFACRRDKELSYSSDIPESNFIDTGVFAKLEKLIELKQFNEMLLEIDSLKRLEEFIRSNELRYAILLKEANALIRLNRLDDATEILNVVMEECQFIDKYGFYYVNACLLLGDVYFFRGNYQVAYKYLSEGKEVSEKKKYQVQLAMCYYHIGMIMYRDGRYVEAINSFKESYNRYDAYTFDIRHAYRQQELMSNIGLAFYKISMYDSCLNYYQKSLDLIDNIVFTGKKENRQMEIARGVIYGNTGAVYKAQKKYEQAIPLLEKNIEINTRPKHDYSDALTSIYYLAEIYMEQGDDNKFVSTIGLADKYIDSMHTDRFMYKIYKLKSDYYASRNNYKNAFDYLRKYQIANDSLVTVRDKVRTNDILLSIESMRKGSELKELRREAEINAKYSIIAISVSLICTLGLIILIWLYRQSRNKRLLLAQANVRIKEQSELLLQANEEILSNIEILKSRDAEKNKIMNMLAVDLQHPNKQVLSTLNQLLKSEGIVETDRQHLKSIHSILSNNNDLIQEILLFSKSYSGIKKDKLDLISCSTLINQAIDANYFKAIQKNIELIYKVAHGEILLRVHPDKLRRAISNIISNALKFSHRNTKVVIFTTGTRDVVNIHIKDEGIGIPDRIKPILFDSDPLARRLGTEGEPAFGLGLTLVKQVIENHQGYIKFNSDTKGSEFIVSLPVYRDGGEQSD